MEGKNNTTTSMNTGNAADYRSELTAIYIWPFVLVVVCTILGILGNTVVLYIYICRWVRTKTSIFLITLSALGLVNSAVNMPIECVFLWRPLDLDHHWLCKLSKGLTFIINNVCACVFVAIAIDRLLLVYMPLRRRVLTVRYTKMACLIALLFGVATSWPGFVFYGSATLSENVDGRTVYGKWCYISDYFLLDSKWHRHFMIVLLVLMVTAYVILIVMYIFIGKKIYTVTRNDGVGRSQQLGWPTAVLVRNVRRLFSKKEKGAKDINKNGVRTAVRTTNECEQRKRKSVPHLGRRISGTNSGASRENTKTLLLVTIAYIVSFLPYVVIAILRSKDVNFYTYLDKPGRIAFHVFLRFYFINSVINPFIYSFSNTQFRQKVQLVFYDVFRMCNT